MQQDLGWCKFLTITTILTVCGSGWAAPAPASLPWRDALPPETATRLAWRAAVPLRSIDSIESWHLVEGYLYAISGEGSVHCVQADTGRVLWSRRLMNPPGTIYPPVAYRSKEFYGVAFTLSSEVVLLDPQTGSEYRRIRLNSPASASCTTSPGFIYSAETNRHIRAYDMKDNVLIWQILMDGPVSVPPVYQPDLETLVLVDGSGLVGMVWANDKEQVYAHTIGGAPQGQILSSDDKLYLATDDNLLNCLDRIKGETLWQYRLPAKPKGGPVICGGSIYQAVAPSGLQRIGIDRDRPNWFAPEAVQFLSEWGGRPVVLHEDGRVAILDPMTGKPMAFVPTGPVAQAVSNTFNDALLLASPTGEVRCLQPAGAAATALASFRPPTTQPVTPPSATQPTTRPVLTRKEKETEFTPLWIRSSGAVSTGTGQTGISRSDRSTRSSRSSRSSRSDRSSRSSRSSRRSSRGGREP